MRTFRQAKARWDHAGETRQVEWKWVRRALLLGAFSLCVTLLSVGVWVNEQRQASQRESAAATRSAAMTEYQQKLSDYQRCLDRAKSGAELKGALMAGVEHAEETTALFRLLESLFVRATSDGSDSAPLVDEFAVGVDEYEAGVALYRASAENYEIVEVQDCPSIPEVPNELLVTD